MIVVNILCFNIFKKRCPVVPLEGLAERLDHSTESLEHSTGLLERLTERLEHSAEHLELVTEGLERSTEPFERLTEGLEHLTESLERYLLCVKKVSSYPFSSYNNLVVCYSCLCGFDSFYCICSHLTNFL